MRKLVSVIIPIYKQDIDADEQRSLKQCIKILNRHPIIFIAPKNLNIDLYKEICEGHISFSIKYFNKKYFNDLAGYNKLMLSDSFYREFLGSKFILIYQLDAFVFKDELEYWCKQNYDFIGAPHPAHNNQPGEIQFLKNYGKALKLFNAKISNVGNGGFSLRKTRKCYWLVKLLNKQVKKWSGYNEDGFFKYWGNLLYPFFKLPPDEVASHFSIETEPAKFLEKLSGKLPFGCHAYKKHGWYTWKPFIEIETL